MAEWIAGGGVAAIPTDTVYGLACLATHPEAVRALADLKGRDTGQPIAVLFDSVVYLAAHLEHLSVLDGVMPHWPGALTAIVRAAPRSTFVPPIVSAEGTIGVRKPDDPDARAVIRACGGLLAVTSANRHGAEPAVSAEEVTAIFGDELLVLDGGRRSGGVASTVVDLTGATPTILRTGSVTAEALGIDEGEGTGGTGGTGGTEGTEGGQA